MFVATIICFGLFLGITHTFTANDLTESNTGFYEVEDQ